MYSKPVIVGKTIVMQEKLCHPLAGSAFLHQVASWKIPNMNFNVLTEHKSFGYG